LPARPRISRWPATSGRPSPGSWPRPGPAPTGCIAKIRCRADRHWQLRELTGLPLAAAAGDDEELAECVAKLKAGPILG
jgi:hypothetical protein